MPLKIILNSQLDSLAKREETLKQQEAFAQEEVAGVSTLKEKGFAVNSTIRSAHQPKP